MEKGMEGLPSSLGPTRGPEVEMEAQNQEPETEEKWAKTMEDCKTVSQEIKDNYPEVAQILVDKADDLNKKIKERNREKESVDNIWIPKYLEREDSDDKTSALFHIVDYARGLSTDKSKDYYIQKILPSLEDSDNLVKVEAVRGVATLGRSFKDEAVAKEYMNKILGSLDDENPRVRLEVIGQMIENAAYMRDRGDTSFFDEMAPEIENRIKKEEEEGDDNIKIECGGLKRTWKWVKTGEASEDIL